MTAIVNEEIFYWEKHEWKRRFCVLNRFSRVTNALNLYIFKDKKSYVESNPSAGFRQNSLHFTESSNRHGAFSESCHSDIGFVDLLYGCYYGLTLHNKQWVIMLICKGGTHCIALDNLDILTKWRDKLTPILKDRTFHVVLVEVSEWSRLPKNTHGCLLVQPGTICFFTEPSKKGKNVRQTFNGRKSTMGTGVNSPSYDNSNNAHFPYQNLMPPSIHSNKADSRLLMSWTWKDVEKSGMFHLTNPQSLAPSNKDSEIPEEMKKRLCKNKILVNEYKDLDVWPFFCLFGNVDLKRGQGMHIFVCEKVEELCQIIDSHRQKFHPIYSPSRGLSSPSSPSTLSENGAFYLSSISQHSFTPSCRLGDNYFNLPTSTRLAYSSDSSYLSDELCSPMTRTTFITSPTTSTAPIPINKSSTAAAAEAYDQHNWSESVDRRLFGSLDCIVQNFNPENFENMHTSNTEAACTGPGPVPTPTNSHHNNNHHHHQHHHTHGSSCLYICGCGQQSQNSFSSSKDMLECDSLYPYCTARALDGPQEEEDCVSHLTGTTSSTLTNDNCAKWSQYDSSPMQHHHPPPLPPNSKCRDSLDGVLGTGGAMAASTTSSSSAASSSDPQGGPPVYLEMNGDLSKGTSSSCSSHAVMKGVVSLEQVPTTPRPVPPLPLPPGGMDHRMNLNLQHSDWSGSVSEVMLSPTPPPTGGAGPDNDKTPAVKSTTKGFSFRRLFKRSNSKKSKCSAATDSPPESERAADPTSSSSSSLHARATASIVAPVARGSTSIPTANGRTHLLRMESAPDSPSTTAQASFPPMPQQFTQRSLPPTPDSAAAEQVYMDCNKPFPKVTSSQSRSIPPPLKLSAEKAIYCTPPSSPTSDNATYFQDNVPFLLEELLVATKNYLHPVDNATTEKPTTADLLMCGSKALLPSSPSPSTSSTQDIMKTTTTTILSAESGSGILMTSAGNNNDDSQSTADVNPEEVARLRLTKPWNVKSRNRCHSESSGQRFAPADMALLSITEEEQLDAAGVDGGMGCSPYNYNNNNNNDRLSQSMNGPPHMAFMNCSNCLKVFSSHPESYHSMPRMQRSQSTSSADPLCQNGHCAAAAVATAALHGGTAGGSGVFQWNGSEAVMRPHLVDATTGSAGSFTARRRYGSHPRNMNYKPRSGGEYVEHSSLLASPSSQLSSDSVNTMPPPPPPLQQQQQLQWQYSKTPMSDLDGFVGSDNDRQQLSYMTASGEFHAYANIMFGDVDNSSGLVNLNTQESPKLQYVKLDMSSAAGDSRNSNQEESQKAFRSPARPIPPSNRSAVHEFDSSNASSSYSSTSSPPRNYMNIGDLSPSVGVSYSPAPSQNHRSSYVTLDFHKMDAISHVMLNQDTPTPPMQGAAASSSSSTAAANLKKKPSNRNVKAEEGSNASRRSSLRDAMFRRIKPSS